MRKRTSHDERHAVADNAADDAPGVEGHSCDEHSGSDRSRSYESADHVHRYNGRGECPGGRADESH